MRRNLVVLALLGTAVVARALAVEGPADPAGAAVQAALPAESGSGSPSVGTASGSIAPLATLRRPMEAGFLEACVQEFPTYAGRLYLRNYSGCVGLAALGDEPGNPPGGVGRKVREALAGPLGAAALRAHFEASTGDATALAAACKSAPAGPLPRLCGFVAGPRVYPVLDQLDVVDAATDAVEFALVRGARALEPKEEVRFPLRIVAGMADPSGVFSLADAAPAPGPVGRKAGAGKKADPAAGYHWYVVERLSLDGGTTGAPEFVVALTPVRAGAGG